MIMNDTDQSMRTATAAPGAQSASRDIRGGADETMGARHRLLETPGERTVRAYYGFVAVLLAATLIAQCVLTHREGRSLANTFSYFTIQSNVLVLIAEKPDIRMREIATTIGITERAVQRIVDDLTVIGYISVTKDGRRNRYEIQPEARLRQVQPNTSRFISTLFQMEISDPFSIHPLRPELRPDSHL